MENMELTQMSPADIDAAWLAVVAPLNSKLARANELDATAAKYHKAGGHYRETGDRYADRARELREATLAERDEAQAPFLAEWNARGGWTRAYLVPDGHIHRTTACHTLHPTTLISWLPEQSGLSEDEIVEAAGVHACTVCYPTAPVEQLREAEKSAKAATECDGSRKFDYTNFRRTSYTGSGRAVCNHCGETISVSKIGRMKAHPKKKEVTA